MVITIPFLSIIKPDPNELAFLSWGVPKSFSKSSKGDPGGNSNPGNGFVLVTIVCVVEILTTEGVNFSAKSAKDSGVAFVCTTNDELKNKTEIMNIFIFLINRFN